LNEFNYVLASSPKEAASKITELGEEDARVIAGGTALVIMMKEKILSPKTIIDISQIATMRGITYSPENGLWIGSMTTHFEIETSDAVAKYYPSLKDAFHTIGNVRVRIAGTIGGNLAYAEPQCNPPAILAALGATIHVQNSSGRERAIPASGFIRGIFESALEAGEIITSVTIPPPKPRSASAFFKFTTKSSTDKPTSTVAIHIEVDQSLDRVLDARIIVGAVGPKTYSCVKAAQLVKESPIKSLDYAKVASIASNEFEPMDDLYGPSWYKKKVTESIIIDTLKKTISDALNKAR
jgi:carbon-monoxide dehydrogenase medium subunit